MRDATPNCISRYIDWAPNALFRQSWFTSAGGVYLAQLTVV